MLTSKGFVRSSGALEDRPSFLVFYKIIQATKFRFRKRPTWSWHANTSAIVTELCALQWRLTLRLIMYAAPMTSARLKGTMTMPRPFRHWQPLIVQRTLRCYRNSYVGTWVRLESHLPKSSGTTRRYLLCNFRAATRACRMKLLRVPLMKSRQVWFYLRTRRISSRCGR